MFRAKKNKFLVAVCAAILVVGRGADRAQGASPSDMADAAEAMIRTGLSDPETRTEAVWLYEDVLDMVTGDDPASRALRARAHLGLAVINLFDFFDLLPALSSFLGIDLLDLINPAGAAMAGPAGMARPAQACTAIDFEDYLWTLDGMLTNMLTPTIYNARMARQLDPAVTLMIESGTVVLVPDDPDVPGDDSLSLDLAGEWDATDAAFFQGALEVLLGGLKVLFSYDGILQSLINPALSPGCNPPTGSDEWTAVFGPYNAIIADGDARMTEARDLLAEGFVAISDALDMLVLETDDQTDDLIRYLDYGEDGLGPGDTAYPGPDADGTEGNGLYELGEPWGMESVGDLLLDLIGGLLGGGIDLDLSEISKLLPPTAFVEVMDALGQSAQSSTPVDLIPTLIKPLLGILGIDFTEQQLYELGMPALNLGALFNPPITDLSVIDPLKDSNGVPYADPEPAGGDTSHVWPDGSGRVDAPNGVPSEVYTFSMDVDEFGQPVGVLGGLILLPDTTGATFDGDGNLIDGMAYDPMMNPDYNALLSTLGALMP
jgi:hypothetical protein